LKILILKPSSLGDVVQALPVLRLLKHHWPQSEIHWWIESSLAPLLDSDPDLAGIVPFERQRWSSPAYWPEMCRSILSMRRQRFDLVIDLQSLARSGAFAWLTNGNCLIGLDDAREGARGFYDIAVPRTSYHTHAVDWYLSVLRALGVPVHKNFVWMPERQDVSAAIRRKWPVDASRWILLQPGARWWNKRWPVEYFASLTVHLTKTLPQHRFAILGSAADQESGAAIARSAPDHTLDLTGKLSLAEMVEWLRAGDLMISNDTGPMHVAAALDKPVVALFGPTNPSRTGPYGQLAGVIQTRLPCVPCMKPDCHNLNRLECLQSLSPLSVHAAVCARLR
jgi:lipopolysaccharide heptosyltransferase I